MDIIETAKKRHTCKGFSKTKISDTDIQKIKELLQLAPSSTNLQPWHFLLISGDEARQKMLKATDSKYPFNSHQIGDASHIVVFCVKDDIDETYLEKVLAKEEQDGRFDSNPDFKAQMHAGRSMFVDLNRNTFKDLNGWLEKQVYINLGMFIIGVETMGINATTMEGFEKEVVDAEFGLKEKGYKSVLVVPIGYNDKEKDYNAKLPKSRLAVEDVISEF